jgi:hypothetical protein
MSVEVPGGVAFFTSSLVKLKAPLKEVMAVVPDVEEMANRKWYKVRDCLMDRTPEVFAHGKDVGLSYSNK